MEELAFIFTNNLADFNYITSRCFCSQCRNKYDSTIVNYTISLNNLNDIELKGFCKNCNNAMGRYIETGEDPAKAKNAKAI